MDKLTERIDKIEVCRESVFRTKDGIRYPYVIIHYYDGSIWRVNLLNLNEFLKEYVLENNYIYHVD